MEELKQKKLSIQLKIATVAYQLQEYLNIHLKTVHFQGFFFFFQSKYPYLMSTSQRGKVNKNSQGFLQNVAPVFSFIAVICVCGSQYAGGWCL